MTEIPAEWMEQWPDPMAGRPHFNLLSETWGIGGPETRRSRTASVTLVPLLGYPDPNPFERFRLFGGWDGDA